MTALLSWIWTAVSDEGGRKEPGAATPSEVGGIVIARGDICQPVNTTGQITYFTALGPGRRSRARYSLTARAVVNQSRPIFLPQSLPCRAIRRRWLWESPLISAATVRGISSSKLGLLMP